MSIEEKQGKQLGSLHKNDYKVPGLYSERRCVGDEHVSDASLTSHMTTTEQDNDTSTRNHAKHELGALVDHHPAWVGHHTGGSRSTLTVHPCPLRCEGCGWLNSTISPQFIHHGGGAAVLVAVEQGRSASVCNSVCACGFATSECKPTFETHCEATENSPVHQCRNVDDCRMHTCGPHGTCVDGVSSYSGEYDLGFRETDIDGDKLCECLDDCGACSLGSCKPISKMLQGAVFSSEEEKDRAHLTRTSDTPCMIERNSDDECKTRVHLTCSSDSNEGFCVDADC